MGDDLDVICDGSTRVIRVVELTGRPAWISINVYFDGTDVPSRFEYKTWDCRKQNTFHIPYPCFPLAYVEITYQSIESGGEIESETITNIGNKLSPT